MKREQDAAHSAAALPQDDRQNSADKFGADWDPLQGGYQCIIDICDEARARRGDWDTQQLQLVHIFEPERAVPIDQAKIIDNSSLAIMPPPHPFRRRRETQLMDTFISIEGNDKAPIEEY